MSSDRKRREWTLAGFEAALRALGNQDALFSQAVADRLGIHPSDLKCLQVLHREGPLNAGRLAELTGLTTGAVTGLLDRLERAHFVQRTRGAEDRRQVLIEAIPERASELDLALAGMRRRLEEALRPYPEDAIALACELLRKGADVLQGETAELRAAAGTAPSPLRQEGSAPLGGVKRALLQLSAGATNLKLHGDAKGGELFHARFEGKAPKLQVADGTVSLRYGRFGLLDWRKVAAELWLSEEPTWAVEVKGGVSKLEASLATLRLESLSLSGGVSGLTARLPKPAGVVPLKLSGGASQVTLQVPDGVAVRIAVTGGVSRFKFFDQQLGAVGGPLKLERPGAVGSQGRYEIEVSGGASKLSIEL